MKKIKKIILPCLLFFITIIFYFLPFTLKEKCGEFYICKVKFAVYVCDVTTEAGEGENTGYLGTNLRLYKKIGGIPEYFGLKKIQCKSN